MPQTRVDWNAEWVRFKQSGGLKSPGLPRERRVRSPPEQAALRAWYSLQSALTPPSREALLRDWRFWIALLLLLSILTTMWSQSQTDPNIGGLGLGRMRA